MDVRTPEVDERSVVQLTTDLVEELPDLLRAELRLAQAEVTEKGKNLGVGAGLFGASGFLAFWGFGAALATAVLGLAQVLDAWLAALVVTAALLVLAGVAALIGKARVSRGTPPVPARAIAGVQQDVDSL